MSEDDEFNFEYDVLYDPTRSLSGNIQWTIRYTGQEVCINLGYKCCGCHAFGYSSFGSGSTI